MAGGRSPFGRTTRFLRPSTKAARYSELNSCEFRLPKYGPVPHGVEDEIVAAASDVYNDSIVEVYKRCVFTVAIDDGNEVGHAKAS